MKIKAKFRVTYYWYDGPLLFTFQIGHRYYLGVAVGDTPEETDIEYCLYPLKPLELVRLERGACTFRSVMKRKHWLAVLSTGANLNDPEKHVFDQTKLDKSWWLPRAVTANNIYRYDVIKRHSQHTNGTN